MSDNLALECGDVAPAKGFQVKLSLSLGIVLLLMTIAAVATIAFRQEWMKLFGATLISLFLEVLWLGVSGLPTASGDARYERFTWRTMLISTSFYVWPWVVTLFYVTFFMELPS